MDGLRLARSCARKSIVHTMLKNSGISTSSPSRTHRTYSAQFKAELVAACGQPGVSIAALAGQHGMSANVLHRWLKEHQRSGRHQLAAHSPAAALEAASPLAAFIPLQLAAPAPQPEAQQIKVELRRGPVSMLVSWPVSAAAEFASWSAAIVK